MALYTAHVAIENDALNNWFSRQLLLQYDEYTPLWAPMVGDQKQTNQEVIDRLHEVEPEETDVKLPQLSISNVFGVVLNGVVLWRLDVDCALVTLNKLVECCRSLKLKFAIAESDGTVWFSE